MKEILFPVDPVAAPLPVETKDTFCTWCGRSIQVPAKHDKLAFCSDEDCQRAKGTMGQ